MTVLWATGTILCGLVALVWSTRHIQIWRQKRSGMSVVGREEELSDPPRLSVLVAAKDEEDNIAACVRSMLGQKYPDFQLIVVDDRSNDRTSQIAQETAGDDRRFKLVRVEVLPDGWAGKNHAMHTGITEATGEWLCMIDADCTQLTEHSLTAAVVRARKLDADLMSVLPEMELRSFWENVVQPVCSGVMMVWCAPDKVNNPRRPHAYANGAFILIRREAYEQIGGYEAIRGCVQDDLWLARRAKQAGLNLRGAPGEGLYRVRMYSSLRAILRGWTRIFLGTFGSAVRLLASMALVLFMSLMPYLVAAAGWVAVAMGARGWTLAAAVVSTVAVVVQWSVLVRFYRLLGGRPGLFWTYPLGCFVALGCLGSALWKHLTGATVTWRGTSYSAGDVGSGASDRSNSA